jgi:Holliday junction resolvasome RuvABC endonuclease subunit
VGVTARDDGSGAVYASVLEHWASKAEDDVQQLSNLAARIETLLTTLQPDAAVIRRMDWNVQQKRELVAKRGRAEGVVAAVVRVRVTSCRFASGQEVATLCGAAKAAVESDSAAVLGDSHKEAVAAARAALAIAASQSS